MKGTVSETKKIGRHSLYLLIGNIISFALSFFVIVFLTRKLGPENYGIFSYVISIISFLVPFCSLGLTSVLFRDVSFYLGSNEIGKIKGVFLIVSKIVLFVTVILSAGLFFISEFLPYSNYIKLMIPYLFLTVIMGLLISILNGLRRIGLSTLINLTFKILLVLFLFILIDQNIVGIILSYSVSMIIPIFLSIWFIYKMIYRNVQAIKVEVKRVFSFSLPIFIGQSLSELTLYLNVFILTYFSFLFGMKEIGFYSLGLNIAMFFVVFLMFIPEAIAPAIIQFYGERNKKRVLNSIMFGMKYTFLFVFPIIFSIISSADIIILDVFKKPYTEAIPVLQILSVGIFFSILSRMLLPLIYATERTKDYMWLSLIMVIILIPLSAILSYRMGAIGASIARIASISVIMFYFLFLIKKLELKINKSIILKECILSSIFLLLFLVPRNIVFVSISWVGLFLLYLMLLFASKILRKEDVKKIINIK